ncbi:exocyst complex component EXO70H1-like [Arachis stenosperma]|uniref:exocyst complex component EXO70H1-like n=1 Tax=Arachis stenosperma TaxID=217475 RepID=UPI0025ABAFC4|nr:exocyst complex component EXO70H1-like [Arachis stenosperma]
MPRKGMRSIFFKPSPSHHPPRHYSLPPPSPLRTFSDTLMDDNIHTAESLITKWDYNNNNNNSVSSRLSNSSSLFSGTRLDAKHYVDAVKGLQSAMKYLVAQDPSSAYLLRAQSLMQIAMKTLEREFHQILKVNREYLDPETVSNRSETVSNRSSTDFGQNSFSDIDEIVSDDEFRFAGEGVADAERASMLAVNDLKGIADCMISTGYGRECVRIYVLVRKSIVDEALYNLGVEQLSFSRLQKMDWEVVELKIKHWLNAMKVAVGTLFNGERILCDSVFATTAPEKRIAESSFAEITRDGAMMLFGFPEMVAKCKKTPEKMFRTLDMYEAISENWPQIESIFSFESTARVRTQAVTSLVKLGDAVRTMLSEFESAIQKEPCKTTIPGGGVHPITGYVLNYISLLADYSGVLVDIIADYPQSPLPESFYRSPIHEDSTSSSFSTVPSPAISERIAWLILVVLCKLDVKAERYKDVALSYLFLANNMHYVVEKVRKSNLGLLVGEEWMAKHEAKTKEYIAKYERVGWNSVLTSLPENPAAEISAEQAKACFVSFNTAFHEACKKQIGWVVPDPKLRDEIKVSIALKLVSKYGEFYDKNRVGSDSAIRFLPDDIGNQLSDILYGIGESSSGSSHALTTSSSRRSNGSRR